MSKLWLLRPGAAGEDEPRMEEPTVLAAYSRPALMIVAPEAQAGTRQRLAAGIRTCAATSRRRKSAWPFSGTGIESTRIADFLR